MARDPVLVSLSNKDFVGETLDMVAAIRGDRPPAVARRGLAQPSLPGPNTTATLALIWFWCSGITHHPTAHTTSGGPP